MATIIFWSFVGLAVYAIFFGKSEGTGGPPKGMTERERKKLNEKFVRIFESMDNVEKSAENQRLKAAKARQTELENIQRERALKAERLRQEKLKREKEGY